MNRNIYFNEDDGHFYEHPAADMTPEGVDRLVDTYAENTQVAGVLFCVNLQRALFDSAAWETFWVGYDPALGDDQPALQRGNRVLDHALLRERGIDQFERWLARCRHHGIEGWLTMRMNDCHGLGETAFKQPGAPAWTLSWPSTWWRERPDLRRAPYRFERSWEGAFDYAQAEVRAHHLKLIEEVLGRYDMFGLELDWMRWGMMFKPGHEREGRGLLTAFVRDVRRLADQAAVRLGHPVLLAHRVPACPESALALGYDVAAWAKAGMADMLTLSSFLCGSWDDLPMELWRALVGDKVKLLAHVEPHLCPYPSQVVLNDYSLMHGAAASALHRGADGVYLFNECYRESDDPERLRHTLTHVGEPRTLESTERRFALSYPQVRAAGEPDRAVLPIPLRVPKIGADFGRMAENVTLRFATGPKPKTGKAWLRLGFSVELPGALKFHLNSRPLPSAAADGVPASPMPEAAAFTFSQPLPLDMLLDDSNVVEFIAPQVDGALVWAEIMVVPDRRS